MAEAVNNKQAPGGHKAGESLRAMTIFTLDTAPPILPKEDLEPSLSRAFREIKKTLGFEDDSGYFPRNMLAVLEIKPPAVPLWYRGVEFHFCQKNAPGFLPGFLCA